MGFFDFFNNKDKETLDQGLEKTRSSFFNKLTKAAAGKSYIDDDVLDDLEQILIMSDVGIATTFKIIDRVKARVKKDKYLTTAELDTLLRDEIKILIDENSDNNDNDFTIHNITKPYVIMVVGVNGVGKTTTIGKLAYNFRSTGHKVLLGAADTFRAAAVDQLVIWAQRSNVDIVSKGMHVDPAAVAFETLEKGANENYDVIIIDTAGRLHNKINLMNELGKIKRVMNKKIPNAPHDVLLVLDGSTGQNAFEQAKQFTAATEVTALAVTKLDGTAKGGVVIGIADQFKIPIKYIGVGEKIEDLQLFNTKVFVDSLFNTAKK